MTKNTRNEPVTVLGIDLSKNSFQLHGVDAGGQVVLRKKLSRDRLVEFVANLPVCLIGMEACGGAHHWARVFKGMGHTVRLMAPQFVKPYVKSNKNDATDAEAICEAVSRPSMRFVPQKSIEQQDMRSLHRARSLWVAHRTAQVNQIRGLLMEYGIVIPQGRARVRPALTQIMGEGFGLSGRFLGLLSRLYDELVHIDESIQALEIALEMLAKQDENCGRLMTIPGFGVLSTTAFVADVGDGSQFGSGRELAAWLGLVPRQHSTGGKPTLMGISKRGDTYLRTMLIHGGRAVVRCAHQREDGRSRWVQSLQARRGKNVAAVAVANKNARVAWAMLTGKTQYQAAA